MAFQTPNNRQELANLKILEELQLKKQLLLKQGAAPNLTSSIAPSAALRLPATGTNIVAPTDMHMSSAQRSVLQHANTNSFGYFVTQDSAFGNLILPVLPRFDNIQSK